MSTQRCTICNTLQAMDERHPWRLCADCMARAVDAHGNRVAFHNAGMSGGLEASSPDSICSDGSGRCFVDGYKCEVVEGRFGGVVMQPVTELLRLSEAQLLSRHSAVLAELARRKVVRSRNNPTGDYTEWLVASRLGLTLATNSTSGYDATDTAGVRYQIKGRRVTADKSSAQLGVIRNLEGADFDVLAAVVFDDEWRVLRAALIPHAAVFAIASFRKHVNGHVMHLRPSVLQIDGVRDVTKVLS